MTTSMSLGELFDFGEDPLGIYPFKARCLVARFAPQCYEYLLEMGRPVVEYILGISSWVPRMLKYGCVTLYFPERWLSLSQQQMLMAALVDVHDTYPLKYVYIVTASPVIISDFCAEMVRTWG